LKEGLFMASASQIRANAKYDSTHCTGLYLKLNKETDKDILEKLSSVPNRQGYIKSLIRQDLSRTCSVPKQTDSVPVSSNDRFRDPFADALADAVATWHDKATSVLSDERPYIIRDSVPKKEGE
jgi:hypothetical protein